MSMKVGKLYPSPLGIRHLPDDSLANIQVVPFSGEIITSQLLAVITSLGGIGLSLQEKGVIATVKSTKEDLVTEADEILTEGLKREILRLFPVCAFLDEESKETHDTNVTEKDL